MESRQEREARIRLERRVARLEGELRTLAAAVERRAREGRKMSTAIGELGPLRPRS